MSEPWVRFEDEHLLAVSKPAGVNTHRADIHAQDGMYEWVQAQRSDQSLSILHRLDKPTSGLLLFGKTPEANRSVTAQFEARTVAKRYELLVERDDRRPATIHACRPIDGTPAETDLARQATGSALERWSAQPHTGRTHQVRVHATEAGLPVLGDGEHHGAAAPRLFLHAAELAVTHPDGHPLSLGVDRPASFDRALEGERVDAELAALVAHEARAQLFDPADTNAYLWIDRHHDGFPATRVERLGDVARVLSYGDHDLPRRWLDAWTGTLELQAIYEQRRPRGGGAGPARLVAGEAHDRFAVVELGVRYLVDLQASATSSGLFLDQRETRRRLLSSVLVGQSVLNAFAHTGSLSVAAARAGAETLTLDLSPRYLEWASENLRENGIDPADHDAVYGDALEWLDRFAKKGRTFDLVLVDPPSSSTARKKGAGRWVVDRDLHDLVTRATRVVAPGGTLFVSTNLHRMTWPAYIDHLERGLAAAGRAGTIDTRTLPLDHRSGAGDPPYLKVAWVTLSD
ncbi:MAG: pseudouridine synthase [Acidimicrobiales bacterium]